MIVVAGAGPAGLAAALAAARAGHEVTLIEADDHVGGMARSFELAGMRVDLGSHRLHPAMSDDVSRMLLPLLGDDLQVRERNGRARIADRWISFPLRASELLTALPPRVSVRMALDVLASPSRSMREDSFAEFVRAGLGPTVLEEFYGPFARKLWGRSPDDLAGEIARRRIAASSPLAILGKVVRAREPAGRRFLYPRGGFGLICERLAEAAADAGADIRLGSPLSAVTTAADGSVRVEARGVTIDGSALVSTVPLAVLVKALGQDTPVPIAHRGLVLAYLVVDRRQWTSYDAHYVPDLTVAASRLSEPRNYRDDPADPPDRSVVCVEIPASLDDACWTASPEEIGARTCDDLARLDLPTPPISEVVVRRVRRVYPVYAPGESPLRDSEHLVDRHPNVMSVGRGGRVNADNTHHAIDMGLAAIGSLRPNGTVNTTIWRSRRQRFEDHVVED